MSIPLDDLLPTSDAAYEPPADLRELFTRGSPLCEMADVHKFSRDGLTWSDFRDGYDAAYFDMWLKTGLQFFMNVSPQNVDRLVSRARGFGRTVEVKERAPILNGFSLVVSKHGEPQEALCPDCGLPIIECDCEGGE